MDSALVSPAWLADRLGSPELRVIEVSVADDSAYRAGHILGAVW